MNALLIAIALLTGPPVPSSATLQIRIHVGQGRESDIIRHELRRPDDWFFIQRLRVEANYRIMLVDDLYRSRPCYQIGTLGEIQPFRPGTFCASGTFLRSLLSIAEQDRFDRDNVLFSGSWADDDVLSEWARREWNEIQSRRPTSFPPDVEVDP